MKQLKVALRILFIGIVCMIPTLTYGKHGGFFKESKDKPIDEMDEVFFNHDRQLEEAYNNWQQGIKDANQVLLNRLKFIKKPQTLYGKFYLKMTQFTFNIDKGFNNGK